jgi:aspartyl aminopeptidase
LDFYFEPLSHGTAKESSPHVVARDAMEAPGLIDFLNASWTPYHATYRACETLKAHGYVELNEARDDWRALVVPGGKYFYTRNASAVVAFAVGGKYRAGDGFVIVGAHTDSPCPKLKPNTRCEDGGAVRLRVQPYGGGLWHTWFDRDLGLAGRVVLKRKSTGEILHRLVKVDRAVCRIPTLAIHLDRGVNDGFKVNFQQHMAPILASSVKAALEKPVAAAAATTSTAKDEGEGDKPSSMANERHHPLFLKLIADELGCEPDEIVDFDLQLCDTQPSAIGGAQNEFIFSGRLDNLVSCYTSLRALIETTTDEALKDASGIRMIMHFDHEEVGSESSSGAAGAMTTDSVRRITAALNPQNTIEGLDERTRRASFCVSSDMAHALHPNYADRHEPGHAPKMHGGLVIKHNANQRYATDAITAFMFRELGERAGVPVQEFVVRSDTGCGSTIGPIFSTRTGIRTVDVGAAQLSMHSIREMCGVDDIDHAVKHLAATFTHFASLDAQLIVDGAIGDLCRPCDMFETTELKMSLDADARRDDLRTYADTPTKS